MGYNMLCTYQYIITSNYTHFRLIRPYNSQKKNTWRCLVREILTRKEIIKFNDRDEYAGFYYCITIYWYYNCTIII